MNNCKLVLDVQEPYLSFIKSSEKKVEGRLGKDKYLTLQKEDTIKINDIEIKVIGVRKYASFQDMLKAEGVQNVIPDARNLSEALEVFYKYYSKEDEKQFGAVAISIKLK